MPKIPSYPPMTTPDGPDAIPIEDISAGATKYITLTKLKEWLQSLTAWITTAMITDANVTPDKWTNQYRFRVSRNAAANAGINSVPAIITFDTEQYDTNNNFASGLFTAPVTGVYRFTYRTKWITGGAEQVLGFLYKNGAFISAGTSQTAPGVAHMSVQGTDELQLTAGDTVGVYVANSAAGAKALEVGAITTYFAGSLVSKV